MTHLLHLFAYSSVALASGRVSTSWQWYIIRGAGFAATGLLLLLMLSGIGQVTGLTYRFIEPIKAWLIHKIMAIALAATITVHVGFLLYDHYVHFSAVQLFVPLLSNYSNNTTLLGLPPAGLAVTLGILAAYGVAILLMTSLKWIDTKKTLWRRTHYVSYIVVFCVFLHGVFTGSDLKYGAFRLIWIIIGLLLGIAIIYRVNRTRSRREAT